MIILLSLMGVSVQIVFYFLQDPILTLTITDLGLYRGHE